MLLSRPNKRPRIDHADSDIDMPSQSSSSSTTNSDSDEGPAEPPLPPGVLSKKHLIFKKWAISKGVEIHPSITPAALPGRGIGLQTTSSIPSNTRILFIPEKAIFKPRPQDAKDRENPPLSPHAHLALSALRVFPRDESLSYWSDTWPKESELRPSLPLFWDEKLQEKLPLSTKAVLERQQRDFQADKLAANKKRKAFDYFWAIVNSRSFHWKPPGRNSKKNGGYMVLCPFIDYLNHGPAGTGVNVEQTSKGFEVTTDRDYEPNEELLLTYGAHSNDKLLVHYGFTHTPPTPTSPSDDSIPLDNIILPKLSDSVKLTLQNTGYLGSYTYTPSRHEFCFRTQVAIRAHLFSANEWEYFCLNGEDMGVDRGGMVREWLEVPLEGFLEEARVKGLQWGGWEGEGKRGREGMYAVSMIRGRWREIERGLEGALGGERKEEEEEEEEE